MIHAGLIAYHLGDHLGQKRSTGAGPCLINAYRRFVQKQLSGNDLSDLADIGETIAIKFFAKIIRSAGQ